MCITGCSVWCSYPEINDVGLTAARRAGKHGEEIGFSVGLPEASRLTRTWRGID